MIVELEADATLGVRVLKSAVIFAGDYLNKLTGEQIERECKSKLAAGYTEIVVNFSSTEIVNSIGVSILLGVIDSAASSGARVVFSDVNEDTVELFEMLGITKHVDIREW
ncbi:MAG: STAS domain-containing protein [Blastocatellia bacterium]|nr:STAS domain-containing protein [Blastocatellia bacterium]